MTMPVPSLVAPVLEVVKLGKEYKLYDSPRQRVKALLSGKALHRSHWALRDVSFTLHRGQCIGVIGDNGAGKSSLLKLLAGTMQPSTGSIQRAGRITAILELGAGFHPDFTGRENLYFAGSLIGIDREEMQNLEPEIIAFSELHNAIDRPVKTYSSGMSVRLAFALVTAVRPDVLIVDEALAVGDQSFQKKCIDRILDFRKQGCTILFCSHSPYHIRHLCDSAIWLEKGEMRMLGETEAVLSAYEVSTRSRDLVRDMDDVQPVELEEDPAAPAGSTGEAVVHGARLLSVELRPQCVARVDADGTYLIQGHELVLDMTAAIALDAIPSFGFMLEQLNGVGITSVAMHVDGVTPVRDDTGKWHTTLTFPDLSLHTGAYVISAYLFDESGLMVMDEWLRFKTFRVVSEQRLPGIVHLPHSWGGH